MSTTLKNFVSLLPAAGSNLTSVLLAIPAAKALSLSAAALGTILDKLTVDLSSDGYAKHGGALLTLVASTPQTIDLTNLGALAAYAGDVLFATANTIIFHNTGAFDVVVSPGAANPFNGPLAGTAPLFTVPAGATTPWLSPAGWAVTGAVKTLRLDPGANACTIAVMIAGS